MSAHVQTRRRSVRSLRMEGAHVRWVLTLVALIGIGLAIKNAIWPPAPFVPPAPRVQQIDAGAERYAEAFTRAYLTYDSERPELHQEGLARFLDNEQTDPDAGFTTPSRGSQRVDWADVVQSRPAETGGFTYTIAAQTTRAGLVYLTVTVRRYEHALQIVGYPALVGAPVSAPLATPDANATQEVTDEPVIEVVSRALRNYLDGNVDDLVADVSPGAIVSVPDRRLALQEVQSIAWSTGGVSVFATVTASDEYGGVFQLTYELDVDRTGERPFVSAIQTNPHA